MSNIILYNNENNALYLTRDFFKLWHLKMSVVECKDPTSEAEMFSSNTYYPPGTYGLKGTAFDEI